MPCIYVGSTKNGIVKDNIIYFPEKGKEDTNDPVLMINCENIYTEN